MAKTDNLTDFLTGVAGAIRTKKGTTALINPQDFESEIGSIDTAKPEQNKTLTVTENGTQTVKPDTGKVLSGVTVTTNVPATPTEEKTVDLAMASGNQVVTPASGKHLTKVTITKPATLAAGNIKSGVNIGGVTGTLSPAKTEQAKTVDLAMASGNQVVSPDSGKVLSSVTITKPTTLVASNIKKGVTIGGVAGSYAPTFTTETKTVALAMGSGNTGDIEVSFSTKEYEVETVQGRFQYYDEQAMTDPMVVQAGLEGIAKTMINDFTAKAVAEFDKATLTVQRSGFAFTDIVDAIAKLNTENEDGLFILVGVADLANFRKELKDDLKYNEAFVRTGYVGSVCGVPVIVTKAITNKNIYLASKEAVTLFIKKDTEVEQERDANVRNNKVYIRKVAVVALTDENKVVKLTPKAGA